MTEDEVGESEAAPAVPVAENATPKRKRRTGKTKKPGKFYVFETPRGHKPVLVSRGALPILKANTFARVGAAYGKHDRVVTTDPKGKDFKLLVKYKAGTGKKVRAR